MTVLALASASGAPGVTTSALALALTWPQPVLLVEADPTGASAISAGWFRGRPPHNRGLVNVALAHRHGDLAAGLREVTLPLEGSNAQIVAGARSPGQAVTISQVWEPLTVALRTVERAGTDVIIDLGRLGMAGSPHTLLRAADVVLLVARTSLPSIAGARVWARRLADTQAAVSTGRTLGVLTVDEEHRAHRYGKREMASAIGAAVVAELPWDPEGAAVLSLGHQSRRPLARSHLVRAARASVSAIQVMADKARSQLDETEMAQP